VVPSICIGEIVKALIDSFSRTWVGVAVRQRFPTESKGETMPPRGVKKGSKRERQYKHIRKSEKEAGRSTKRAEEIASRAVNKEKARAGESKTSSRSSTSGSSASARGGKQSGKGPGGRTREQLYNDAKKLGVEGRSKMSKQELQHAVAGAS
jgi:hypothetical protein